MRADYSASALKQALKAEVHGRIRVCENCAYAWLANSDDRSKPKNGPRCKHDWRTKGPGQGWAKGKKRPGRWQA